MSGRGDGTDEDAVWRSIVANYGERASLDEPGPGPGAGAGAESAGAGTEPDVDPDLGRARSEDVEDRDRPEQEETRRRPPPVDPRLFDPPPLDPWVERHLAEERFEPPVPDPTPLPEPRRLLAWLGVLGVPVLLLLLVVLPVAVPSWASLLMLVWFLGGFGYLVATMRRGDDDDWDDGAVV